MVSLGGNALASPAAPHIVVHDAAAVTTSIVENVRWLVGAVAAYAAPDACIVLITPAPRAQLSDPDLAAYRRLSSAMRDVVVELAPRCVLLDVEMLLQAERARPGSWRRGPNQPLPGRLGGPEKQPADRPRGIWSGEAEAPGFPRG